MNLFNDKERKIIAEAIEIRLVSLWSSANKLPCGCDEYSKLVDETLKLRKFCRRFNIKLDDSVGSRF